jgi:hypothetical protein
MILAGVQSFVNALFIADVLIAALAAMIEPVSRADEYFVETTSQLIKTIR